MAPIPLFVTATKIAGVLVTITFAANAVSYSRYRKRNLAPFESPIDETNETLAVFNVHHDDDDDSDDGGIYFFYKFTAYFSAYKSAVRSSYLKKISEIVCTFGCVWQKAFESIL